MDQNEEARIQPIQFSMADSIPKFDGEDVTYSSSKWSQDIDDNAEIFGWTAQQKLIIARRSLSGTAELWLKTEKTFRSYDDLKAALQKEFPDAVNSKQMHEMMAARKKRSNETLYQYMLIMKELGERAKFPDYVAIQYIINGITDYEQNKISLYGITTYAVLKEKLSHYETMKLKMKRGIPSTNKPREMVKPAKNYESNKDSVRSMQSHRCYK